MFEDMLPYISTIISIAGCVGTWLVISVNQKRAVKTQTETDATWRATVDQRLNSMLEKQTRSEMWQSNHDGQHQQADRERHELQIAAAIGKREWEQAAAEREQIHGRINELKKKGN